MVGKCGRIVEELREGSTLITELPRLHRQDVLDIGQVHLSKRN